MSEPRDEKPKSYGRTRSGLEITDELIERYVAEAEAGFDLDKLRPVRPDDLDQRRKSLPSE